MFGEIIVPMINISNLLLCASMLAVSIGVVGCSAPPPKTTTPTQTHITEIIEVFDAGYRSIAEKYINNVDLKKIALEGIRGFAAIDPALTASIDEQTVFLIMNGKKVAVHAMPAYGTSRSWAEIIANFAVQARSYSIEMNRASPEKIYEAVFDGALAGLDVFSRYAGADEARINRANREGFGGIGIRFSKNSNLVIITEVMAGTPAAEAGLRQEDVITHINGEALPENADKVALKLRGPKGSSVRLRLFRPLEERSISMTLLRRQIMPISVNARLEELILYLNISNFNQGTAHSLANEIRKAKALTSDSLRGIVLDLRGNTGGLLKQSVKVADLMLTHGKILTTRGRHPDSLHLYKAGGRDLAQGLPIVVIIDGKSASASEIVAAALQDRERAVIVGTSSYGKGTIQTVIRLPNDGEITLTWSRFLAPSGYALHGLGVLPNICTNEKKTGLKPAIDRAIAKRLTIRSVFASWRVTGERDNQVRTDLRSTCPSSQQQSTTDLRIAKQLVSDRDLFARSLSIAAISSQTRN